MACHVCARAARADAPGDGFLEEFNLCLLLARYGNRKRPARVPFSVPCLTETVAALMFRRFEPIEKRARQKFAEKLLNATPAGTTIFLHVEQGRTPQRHSPYSGVEEVKAGERITAPPL